eukprot:Amastigsp_a178021_123.p1 type:complete len:226 gc:universal Amastigsp_a178021_123:703-26(-)
MAPSVAHMGPVPQRGADRLIVDQSRVCGQSLKPQRLVVIGYKPCQILGVPLQPPLGEELRNLDMQSKPLATRKNRNTAVAQHATLELRRVHVGADRQGFLLHDLPDATLGHGPFGVLFLNNLGKPSHTIVRKPSLELQKSGLQSLSLGNNHGRRARARASGGSHRCPAPCRLPELPRHETGKYGIEQTHPTRCAQLCCPRSVKASAGCRRLPSLRKPSHVLDASE